MVKLFSEFLKINAYDLLKGLVMAVLTAGVTLIYQTVNAGSWVFDWDTIWKTSASAGLAYIVKQLFTNSNGEVFAKEAVK